MDIHFHLQQEKEAHTANSNHSTCRLRNRGANKNKFVGVRQRPSGKWVAEIKNTTQKIRMWLGTFDTAEEAALAYDEAACLLRGSNTRTNFVNNVPSNPALSLKIRNLLNHKRSLNKAKPSLLPNKASNTEIRNLDISTKALSPSSSSQISTRQSFSHIDCSPTSESSTTPSMFDGAYKPDLSSYTAGYGMFPSQFCSYDHSLAFPLEFDKIALQQNALDMPTGVNVDPQLPEIEHMKVERQISASLYAMNGINEYWQNVQDNNDSFWDLPTLCQMFCPS